MGKTMGGRRVTLIFFLLIAVFWGGVMLFTFSQNWRQSERMMAAGLKSPRGAVWTPDEGIVVAEAGGASAPSGRLTWVSTFTSRVTVREDLPGPTGVARAADGRLLILMGGCPTPCASLAAMDLDGRLETLADLRELSEPWGLAVAPDGVMYVSDAAGGSIWRIDPGTSGRLTRYAALPVGSSPRGLAVGTDGTLYAALFGAGAVVRVRPEGSTTLTDGLRQPIAVAAEPDGKLLVLEMAGGDASRGFEPKSGRLLRLDPTAPTVQTALSSGLDMPTALARAPDGRVYVTTRGLFAPPGEEGALIQIRRLGPRPPGR